MRFHDFLLLAGVLTLASGCSLDLSSQLTPTQADRFDAATTDPENCASLQAGITYYVDTDTESVLVINSQQAAEAQDNLTAYQTASDAITNGTQPVSLNFQALQSFCTDENLLAFFELGGVQPSDDHRAQRTFVGFRALQAVPQSIADIQPTIVVLAEQNQHLIKMTHEVSSLALLPPETFERCAALIDTPSDYLNCFADALASDQAALAELRTQALLARFTLDAR